MSKIKAQDESEFVGQLIEIFNDFLEEKGISLTPKEFQEKEGKKITAFRDEYAFLSNFFPCKIHFQGLTYLNAEATFQAQKSMDQEIRKNFTVLDAPSAKKYGRQIKLRPDWDEIKVDIMTDIVYAKFNQQPDLRERLLKTGLTHLEEGNTWGDRFWGTVNGNGKNILGNILMDVRKYYRTINGLDEAICGQDYDKLAEKIRTQLSNWGMLAANERPGRKYLGKQEFKNWILETYDVPNDNCTMAPAMLDGILDYAEGMDHEEQYDFFCRMFPGIDEPDDIDVLRRVRY